MAIGKYNTKPGVQSRLNYFRDRLTIAAQYSPFVGRGQMRIQAVEDVEKNDTGETRVTILVGPKWVRLNTRLYKSSVNRLFVLVPRQGGVSPVFIEPQPAMTVH